MPGKKAPSAGRQKLEKLALTLPALPMTTAGSLPKQAELTELRYRVSKGIQQSSELDKKEKLSTEIWIRQQEKLGFDILVDGEMIRGDMIHHFAKKISGFDEGGTVRCYGNRYYRKPIIKSKLEWKESLIAESWKYAQRLTNKPVKAVLTGPYTLLDWSFNEFYAKREDACRDLALIYRREIQNLVELGARLIQFDEPAVSSRPEDVDMVRETLEEITRGFKSYFILRHCYGNLEPAWKKMQAFPVDNFHIELTNSEFTFLPHLKKNPTTKDLSLGVINSHNHVIDPLPQVQERIKKVLKAAPAPRVWLTTDSGLKTRTVEEALGKLSVLSAATKKARTKL